MTAPSGPILFNASTGSDTAASGLGPATAVTGAGASLNATSTVDLSADTPDLSGVSAGDLLWVDTSSGRQFSVIASVNDGADTVTCDDAFGVTESSRNWGIGGKRATFDNANSRKLFTADVKIGWTIETETDQSLTSRIVLGVGGDATGLITCQGDEPNIRTITQTVNDEAFTMQNGWHWRRLKVQNTNGTKTAANGFEGVGALNIWENCVLGGATNTLATGIKRTGSSPMWAILQCQFVDCADGGVFHTGGGGVVCRASKFSGCGGNAQLEASGNVVVTDSLFVDGVADGVKINSAYGSTLMALVRGSLFHGNGGDGLELSSTVTALVENNVFDTNGGYGVNSASANAVGRNNAFRSNTIGEQTGMQSEDANPLTADPFVNSASNDFNLNDTAGGGTVLRAVTVDLG